MIGGLFIFIAQIKQIAFSYAPDDSGAVDPLKTSDNAPRSNPSDWEFIIVNNRGADVEFLLQALPDHLYVSLLRLPNQGPASAQNLGEKSSRAALSAFFDDGCIPT